MKQYLRLLRFVRPHMKLLLWTILFMFGYAVFSGATVGLVLPFSRILFHGGDLRGFGEDVGTVDGGSAAGATAGGAVGEVAPADAKPKSTLAENLKHKAKDMVLAVVVADDKLATLRRFCLLIMLVFLLKNIFWYVQSFMVVRMEQSVVRDIRNALYQHYLKLPIEFYTDASAGVLVSRITNDVGLVREAIANGFAQGIRQVLVASAYLVAVVLANWRLFLMTLVVAPPTLYLINRVGRRLRLYSTRSQERMANITGVLQETITGTRIIKAFNLEGHMSARFHRVNQALASAMIRMTRTGALAPPITEMFGATVGVMILYVGGRDILRGTGMEGGQFLMFVVGMFALMQPLRTLSHVTIQVEEGIAASTRIFEVLDTRPAIEESPQAVALAGPIREIRYENVSFSYVPGVPVLSEVSVTVRAGELIAFVGLSGAGKSTLVDLMPRFYDPTAGRILINGLDIREYTLDSLRSMMGLVTQETVLFDDTVGANIGLGKPGATREDIERAAMAANAHTFITALPGGYEMEIGDRGTRLSGGQRQRLAIARAILRDPPILIFDEATSALDSESEALVQEAVERLVRNRTTFVIAHRLSTVLGADRILVLDQGRIVDVGTHAELLERGGLYHRLYTMQFRDKTAVSTGDV